MHKHTHTHTHYTHIVFQYKVTKPGITIIIIIIKATH